jgi:hypothetical protein
VIWLPWRRTKAALDAARQAVAESQAATRDTEELAAALDRLRRQNHLSPKIRAAFRAHPGGSQ